MEYKSLFGGLQEFDKSMKTMGKGNVKLMSNYYLNSTTQYSGITTVTL